MKQQIARGPAEKILTGGFVGDESKGGPMKSLESVVMNDPSPSNEEKAVLTDSESTLDYQMAQAQINEFTNEPRYRYTKPSEFDVISNSSSYPTAEPPKDYFEITLPDEDRVSLFKCDQNASKDKDCFVRIIRKDTGKESYTGYMRAGKFNGNFSL
jgi:hypothetical protein